MDECTAFLPIFKHGHKVGDVTYHIRANWDDALGGLTADIAFEDASGKRHVVPEAEVKSILNEIRDHDKQAWREIQERAKQDDLEGVYRCYCYDDEPITMGR